MFIVYSIFINFFMFISQVAVNKDGRKCPTCNAITCLKDIRILYAKNLIAVDTTELTSVQRKLEEVRLQVLKVFVISVQNFKL